ncbi:MAG: hypothetical protein ACTSU0_10400 [Alphaproteobacteria bacterium]
MQRTLIGAAVAALCLIAPARAEPPRAGSIVQFLDRILICKARESVEQIAVAAITGDSKVIVGVVTRLTGGVDPECVFGKPMTPIIIGPAIHLGEVDGDEMWAVGLSPLGSSGEQRWALLRTPPTVPQPSGWHV